jgi:ATP-dependent DNA helicase RecG
MNYRGPRNSRSEFGVVLSTPIEKLPQVGLVYQKRLKKLGIKTVGELIFHFPHRYEDFSNMVLIAKAESGRPISVQGKILDIKNIRTFKKRMTLTQAVVGDKSGAIKVIWFNQPYLINSLKKGDSLFLAGKITSKAGSRYLSSPAYEKIPNGVGDLDLTHTGRLIPVYPETEGLSSRWLRFIVKPLLTKFKKEIPDSLPEKIRDEYNLLPLEEAIWQIHFPDSLNSAKKAKERFVFEELFNLSLVALRERMKLAKERAVAISSDLSLTKKFTNSLDFKLTGDQKKAAWQILKDLEGSRPMNRLLEGDVGSGKTVVATIAALNVVKAGFQVAFLAPTEILAKQHFMTITKLLKKFNLSIGLITGKESRLKSEKVSRKQLLEKAKDGEIGILIGTHALVQEEVRFGKLALVIIDEQHRFGVEQRARLCQPARPAKKNGQKGPLPHLLSMTATPIPRTLSLTIYGDLDLSLIKELPKGRKKVITKVIPPGEREKTYNFIEKEVKKRGQVFVICPRIEPAKVSQENLDEETKRIAASWIEVKAVKEEYEKLSKEVFPNLKVSMLHGKMKNEEKEKAMKDFKDGKIDVLVSTSVIEVGVDIPNATVMIIEGADKFGLSQLHQFRGRVGRGKEQSFCFLFTEFPAKRTSQRLKAITICENGFELAEKDLQIRGPGDFSGQRQWGFPDFVMDSLKNISLVEKVRQAAKEILTQNPELKKYPLLGKKLKEIREKIHLE